MMMMMMMMVVVVVVVITMTMNVRQRMINTTSVILRVRFLTLPVLVPTQYVL
jgi:hypothetical protein